MLKATIQNGSQKFNLFDPEEINTNILDIIVLCTASIIFISTFIFGIANKYLMTRLFAKILIAIYATFFIACLSLGIRNAYKTY